MSEGTLNNVVIDSSGLLLWFTVSDKHLRHFSWAGKDGSTLEEVTLKLLECIVRVWQWPCLSQEGIEGELRRTSGDPSSPSLKTPVVNLNRLAGYSCRENLAACCLQLQHVVRK